MTENEVEAVLARPTCSVDQYMKVIPVGRNAVYAGIRRGDIQVMKVGRRLLILTAPLRRKLNGEAA